MYEINEDYWDSVSDHIENGYSGKLHSSDLRPLYKVIISHSFKGSYNPEDAASNILSFIDFIERLHKKSPDLFSEKNSSKLVQALKRSDYARYEKLGNSFVRDLLKDADGFLESVDTVTSCIDSLIYGDSLKEAEKVSDDMKLKAALVIADVARSSTKKGSPEDIANAAIIKWKSGSHTPKAWKLFGKVLSSIDKLGIVWDKKLFSEPTLRAMDYK